MPARKKADKAAEELKRFAEKSATGTELSPEERLHNTKLLLRSYRRVAYSIKISEEELNLRFEADHGTMLSTLEVNAELAGMDLTNTKLESYTRAVIRSKQMLGIIHRALEAVRQDPDRGELMYQVLYLTYFSPRKHKNGQSIVEALEEMGFRIALSTYYSQLDAAVKAIDRILWGYTARDCMEILDRFLPQQK